MFVTRIHAHFPRLTAGVLAAAAFASGARAQPFSSDVEEVTVAGSRIAAPGFQSPNPVTQISPLQYDVKEEASVVDLMADIPGLSINQALGNAPNVGASNFDLHNLGPFRTLVLVNGLRTEATGLSGNFDVNVLPASLIEHIDIVTGGASAAYGSDAIAGAVDITLNTTLEGLRARAGYGASGYGDDQTFTASGAWGTAFAGGRGHVVLGSDYFDRAGVAEQDRRPWGRNNWGLIPNPSCTTITTTCSELLLSPNVLPSQVADGGVITSAGPLQNIAFGPGGVPIPFTVGADAGTAHMIGGSGSTLNQLQPLQAAVTRVNFLTHADYDLGDRISVWGEFLYAKTTQGYAITPNYDNGDITITSQNPYIPASILATMTANKITSFTMGRTNYDLGTSDFGRSFAHGINTDYDGSAGVKGAFNVLGSDWIWDLNAQYFANGINTSLAHNRIEANWTNALDAVANPAVGGVTRVAAGQPVCRSTLTAPNNGCVPADIFGPNTLSSAVRSYVTGTSQVTGQLVMLDTSANFHGEPFSTWAGPVAMAFGGEYRHQTTDSQSDPISQAMGWRIVNAIPYKGAVSVEGGYVELGVPLATALNLDAAARASSFSNSGGVTSWKLGLNYSPLGDLRLRATRSHDIHGPTLSQLFQAGVVRSGSAIVNPATGVKSITTTDTTGNPDLRPEIGDTITAGAVYTPSWLDRFTVSADYWNIRVSGAVVAATELQAVTNCFAGQTAFCHAISYTGGVISQVLTTQFNAGLVKTDGWDFEANYQFAMGDLMTGLGGTMRLRALATYVMHNITSQFGTTIDEAGCVGACNDPRLRYGLNAIYLNDPWTVSLAGNWLGGGVYDQLYNGGYTAAEGGMTINNNKINGRFYVNMSVAYQLTGQWQLFARVNNLFNVSPPLIPDSVLSQDTVARTSPYDRIGLQWLAGVKLRLD